jgi:hypothetical protein
VSRAERDSVRSPRRLRATWERGFTKVGKLCGVKGLGGELAVSGWRGGV